MTCPHCHSAKVFANIEHVLGIAQKLLAQSKRRMLPLSVQPEQARIGQVVEEPAAP